MVGQVVGRRRFKGRYAVTVTLELVPIEPNKPSERVEVRCSEEEWSALYRSGTWQNRRIIAMIIPGSGDKPDATIPFV